MSLQMILVGTETVFMWQAASEETSAPAAEEPVKEEAPKVAAVVPVQAQPQLASKKSATAKEIAITAHAERPRKAQVIKADKADMHDAPVSASPAASTATPTDVAVSSPCPASVPACLYPQLSVHSTLGWAVPCLVMASTGHQAGSAPQHAVNLRKMQILILLQSLPVMQGADVAGLVRWPGDYQRANLSYFTG